MDKILEGRSLGVIDYMPVNDWEVILMFDVPEVLLVSFNVQYPNNRRNYTTKARCNQYSGQPLRSLRLHPGVPSISIGKSTPSWYLTHATSVKIDCRLSVEELMANLREILADPDLPSVCPVSLQWDISLLCGDDTESCNMLIDYAKSHWITAAKKEAVRKIDEAWDAGSDAPSVLDLRVDIDEAAAEDVVQLPETAESYRDNAMRIAQAMGARLTQEAIEKMYREREEDNHARHTLT